MAWTWSWTGSSPVPPGRPRPPPTREPAGRRRRGLVPAPGLVAAELGDERVGLLGGEGVQPGHRQDAVTAGQEDDVVGEAGPDVGVTLGDGDLLAQDGILAGGH